MEHETMKLQNEEVMLKTFQTLINEVKKPEQYMHK